MERVRRRILEDQRARRLLDVGLDELEHVALAVDEGVLVLQRPLDVVVPAQGVEVVALVVVERRFLAQPPEHRIRVGRDLDVVGVEVEIRSGGDAPCSPFDGTQCHRRGSLCHAGRGNRRSIVWGSPPTPAVAQLPGPASHTYRGHVPELSPTYRGHDVHHEPGPHTARPSRSVRNPLEDRASGDTKEAASEHRDRL